MKMKTAQNSRFINELSTGTGAWKWRLWFILVLQSLFNGQREEYLHLCENFARCLIVVVTRYECQRKIPIFVTNGEKFACNKMYMFNENFKNCSINFLLMQGKHFGSFDQNSLPIFHRKLWVYKPWVYIESN